MKRTLFRSTFGRWKAFALIGICLVGLACAIYVLAGGACSIGYRASSSTNRWEARYLLHSGEMTRALKPHPGEDALEVRAQNLGGRLTVVLSDETGREVYRRDIDGEISTQIPCVSPITARVETRRNRGAFSFQWIRASENPHPDTGKIYLACAHVMAANRSFYSVRYIRLQDLLVEISVTEPTEPTGIT